MNTPAVKERPLLPLQFRAAPAFQWGMAAFTVTGIAAAVFLAPHLGRLTIVLYLFTGLYLLGLALVLSLRVRVEADSVAQAWFWSVQRTPWKQVNRLERTARGFALLNAEGREVLVLGLLPRAAQQMVADEAIHRARLKPGRGEVKPPVLEYWERKPS